MSSEEVKAAVVSPPWDRGSNDFGSRKFTCLAASNKVNAVPEFMKGQYVSLTAVGGDVMFGFSKSSAAAVDPTVAATDAGASTNVGGILKDGITQHFRLPGFKVAAVPNENVYFARRSLSTDCYVVVSLSSGVV